MRLLALALACHPGRDLGHVSVDGIRRTYAVYAPSDLPDRGSALVLVLHGSAQTGAEFYAGSGWREEADAITAGGDGLLVAFLQGETYCLDLGDGATDATHWNVPGIEDSLHRWSDCGHGGDVDLAQDPVHGLAVDDLGYLRAVVDQVLADHPEADPDRVYVTGFSNGGAMVGLAVEGIGTDRFAAASSAGGSPAEVYGPARDPVPVQHTIGSVDEHYADGGPIPVDPAALDQPIVAELIDTYTAVLGLSPRLDQYLPADVPERTSEATEPTATFVYATDADGQPAAAPYQFSVLGGMGHAYPPLGPDTVENGRSFSMPDIDWAFFADHLRAQ